MSQLITSIHNHYQGINAHLNSLLQQDGWDEFHTDHISDIRAMLNLQLDETGYYARLEKGLQIRYEGHLKRPESDILVVDTDPRRSHQHSPALPSETALKPYALTTVLTPADLDIQYFPAVTIYKLEESDHQPVAWIELLSPTNKEGGRHYLEYLEKRQHLLDTKQLAYVEIDYLHSTAPTLRIPDYTQGEAGAKAYHVALIDPRPKAQEDFQVGIISFGMDEPIPVIPIPLQANDVVRLDLNGAYQNTFKRAGYGKLPLADLVTDYASPPVNWHTYTPSDQEIILRRMVQVRELAQQATAHDMKLDKYLEFRQISLPLPRPSTEGAG